MFVPTLRCVGDRERCHMHAGAGVLAPAFSCMIRRLCDDANNAGYHMKFRIHGTQGSHENNIVYTF